MQSFMQNLCAPPQPQLRPISNCDLLEEFTLQDVLISPLEEQEPSGWTLQSKPSDEQQSQEETMDIEEDPFSMKRRHANIIDSSRRLMFSKLQRMDRAPIKRRHC